MESCTVSEPLRIFLVRHGQSEWNAIGRLQGQVEYVELTNVGRRQACAAAGHLASEQVDLLLTSDLRRAVQTAEAVSVATGLAACPDRRLREQLYGVLQGCSPSEAGRAAIDGAHPSARIGGGESLEDVFRRVGSLLRCCIAAARDQRMRGIVLVTHGETIRVALAWLASGSIDRARRVVPPNGSITTVSMTDGKMIALHTVVPAVCGTAQVGASR